MEIFKGPDEIINAGIDRVDRQLNILAGLSRRRTFFYHYSDPFCRTFCLIFRGTTAAMCIFRGLQSDF